MKYQSEIVKEIIDSRGHEKSSLHYQSECIETWIKEYEGSYPKLCDYEGEWLNYINENPIGEFPYETLIDVTTATVNNVVPFAYKSAILKGQSMVNLVDYDTNLIKTTGTIESTQGNKITFTTSSAGKFNLGCKLPMLKPNTKYLLKIKAESSLLSDVNFNVLNKNSNVFHIATTTITDKIYFFTTNNDVGDIQLLFNRNQSVGVDTIVGETVVCEYQEGMEKWNIPYFEGIQSVKMPVLTTSNEDGTKTNILTVNEDVTLRGIGNVKDELDLMTGEMTERIGEIVLNEDITGYLDTNYSVNGYSAFRVTSITNIPNNLKNVICDKVKYYANYGLDWTKQEEFFTSTGKLLFIKILSTKASNFEELRTFLSSTPITIQYELTESVKTVDLTITNQDDETLSTIKPLEGTMHITTSGTPINPLFSGEIPVEAITQNLSSFIEE